MLVKERKKKKGKAHKHKVFYILQTKYLATSINVVCIYMTQSPPCIIGSIYMVLSGNKGWFPTLKNSKQHHKKTQSVPIHLTLYQYG